jgi:hypothetical protein
LTGKAASHDVNNPAPWSAVKGSHIIPNRERGERAIVLPGDEDGLGVGLSLDGTNTSAPEKLPGKDAAASSGKQVEFTQRFHLPS